MSPQVHSICEMGLYYQIGDKIAFVSNQAMEVKIIVDQMEKRFLDEWPDRWARIRETLPPEADIVEDMEPRTKVVGDISDFFFLTEFDLLTAGIGDKITEKVLKSIAASKSVPWAKCLWALGIKDIGQRTAKQLSEVYEDIDQLGRASFQDIASHDGIGPVAAYSILKHFHKASTWWTVERLRLGGVDGLFGWVPPKKQLTQVARNPVEGKEFMFTGRLSITRTKASLLVIEKGGYIGSSVRKDTDYVVVGEDPGEKQFKAQALGLKMINEEQFFSLLEGKYEEEEEPIQSE